MSHQNWQIISKEIIEDVADELKTSSVKVEHVMSQKPERGIEGLFAGMGTSYGPSTTKIVKEVNEMLWLYANKGHTIIIGRGGAFVAKAIKNSLHIRLDAPLKWRIKNISLKDGINENEAKEKVVDMDNKRAAWIERLAGSKADKLVYDIIINKSSFDEDRIVNMIFDFIAEKKMIRVAPSEMAPTH
jgi:cytidylate kinase